MLPRTANKFPKRKYWPLYRTISPGSWYSRKNPASILKIPCSMLQLWIPTMRNGCVCEFNYIVHNRTARPCYTNLPILPVWVHPMGDQWLEPRWQHLIRRRQRRHAISMLSLTTTYTSISHIRQYNTNFNMYCEHVELGGILMQSIHIAADSGWHIGWPIYIAALQRWHIDRSIHIAALNRWYFGRSIHIVALNRWHIIRAIHIATDGANVLVGLYVLLRLRDDILFGVLDCLLWQSISKMGFAWHNA